MKRRHISSNLRFQVGFSESRRGTREVCLRLYSWLKSDDGDILLTHNCLNPTEWEVVLRELRVELQRAEKAGRKILASGAWPNQVEMPKKLTPTEKLKQEIMRLEDLVVRAERQLAWNPRDFLGTP